MKIVFALTLGLFAGAATAAGNKHCFNGYAYHLNSGDFAYTEHHEQTLKGGEAIDWTVVYRDPDGKVIGRKHMNFAQNPYVPVYTLNILDEGYREGIRYDKKDGWRMIRRKTTDAKLETKSFKLDPPIAADSGFHPFVLAHFKELTNGDTVKFTFAAAGRQATVDMRAKRIGDTTFEGRKAVRFRAELDMFLVNYFIDPLVLTYDPDSQKLLEYRGIGNLHNSAGKTYPVRVSYYSKMPEEAKSSDTPVGCADE